MRFRLVPKSSTLDDLELHKSEFSRKFVLLSHFWEATSQQRLNDEDRPALSARELLRIESTFQRCIYYVDIAWHQGWKKPRFFGKSF